MRRTSVWALLALTVVALSGCGGGNRPPSASITSPADGAQLPSLTVTFQGAGQDPEGGPLTYAWSFGDGQSGSGPNPSHTYAQGGTYTVTLTVTDEAEREASATVKIRVNDPPRAAAELLSEEAGGAAVKFASGPAPLELTFAAGRSSDQDGRIVEYRWDFADGQSATGLQVRHVFTRPGEYVVTLTVTDDQGVSDQDQIVVTVEEPPTPPAGPAAAEEHGQAGRVVEVRLVTDEAGRHAFAPALVRVQPGDTVRWVLASGVHTTTSYSPDNQRAPGIPQGAAGWDSGLLNAGGTTFEHTFDVPGTYAYFCLLHEALDMVGLIVVGDGEPALSQDFLNGLPDAARERFAQLLGLAGGGRLITIEMRGEEGSYRFEPAAVRVRPGDTLRWVNVSGPPHTVTTYEPDHFGKARGIPEGAPGFDSGMLMNEGDEFTWTVPPEAPAGTYAYFCLPHEALGMVGLIVVGDGEPALSQDFLAALPDKAREQLRAELDQAKNL